MKKYLPIVYFIIGGFFFASASFAAPTLLNPSNIATTTGSNGDILEIVGGKFIPTTPFAYPFINSATTSALTLSTTTISGSLNTGTLTATSGTSYINALTLGTALPDAQIASAATWNAKQSTISVNSPLSLSGATISCNCSYPFTPTSVLGSTRSGTTTDLFTSGGFYASSTSNLASTTVMGSLNVGTLTATSGTSYLNALSLGTVLSVGNGGTGQNTFTAGNLLYGSAANGISTVGTSSVTCSTGISCTAHNMVGAGGSTITNVYGYPFTPTMLNALTMSATTSNIECLGCGFYASSTSNFSSTTVMGSFNTGTLTATSGTSYLNALSLGTKLADANISSATIWNSYTFPFSPTTINNANSSGTSTPIYLTGASGNLFASSTVGVATTTPGKADKFGVAGDIFIGVTGTTTISFQGKICLEGQDALSNRVRAYPKGTAWVVEAGSCK